MSELFIISVNMHTPLTIYLVDDDTSARKGLTKLLTVTGYKVEAFSSLEDFFQTQPLEISACLIMDASVSELSGMDLHNALVQHNVTIPVVFLSARDDKPSRDKAIAARAAGFFRKPVDGTALVDAIAWAMKKDRRPHL